MVTQRNQQPVVDGKPGVVDGIDGPKIGIDEAVDRTEVRRRVRLAVGQSHSSGVVRASVGNLLVRRYQVEIESEISVCLSGDAIGIAEKAKSVAIDVSNAERGLGAKLMLDCRVSLLDVGTAEFRRKDDD